MQNAIKQFVPTTELNEAFQFFDKIKAENTLANLPKQMRNLGYFVQQIDTPTKPVDFDQFNSELELVNYDSALAQIGSFCDLHDQLVARATWVEYKLQEVENKIQDVLHAIEFNSYNAMLKDGLTPQEVKINYQYAGWKEGLYDADRKAWQSVHDAVSAVFDNGDFVTDEPILYFYNPSIVYSSWHESQNYVMTISHHKFFSLKN